MGKIAQKEYTQRSSVLRSISPPLRLNETSSSRSSAESGSHSPSSSSILSMARSSRFCQAADAPSPPAQQYSPSQQQLQLLQQQLNQPQRPRRAAGTWTGEEDKLLLSLVERYGDRAWVKVANDFRGARDKKQCRERWYNHVDPHINNAPFSIKENIFIMDFYIRHGRQWAKMSRTEQLSGRPDNAIKNHFNTNLIGHYLDLCHENEVDPRQVNEADLRSIQAMLDGVKNKLSTPIISSGKGIKCSRFLNASPCLKIENLMETNKPISIHQRRRKGNILNEPDRHLELYHSPSPLSSSGMPPLHKSASPGETGYSWKSQSSMVDSNEANLLSSSLLLRPHQQLIRTPITEANFSWPSPSVFGTPHEISPSLLSPSVHSDLSLADSEERMPLSTDRFSRWCNANGQYCLPPLSPKSVSPLLGPTMALSIRPEKSAIDEQQKALLASLESRNLLHRERSPRIEYL